jgi:predicted molibdopterin-dependent oxidoreductase YjgC
MRAAPECRHPIPKLCATDSLEAFGSCRLCLVEIEGRRGYPASCTTTPVEAGMQVRTQTPKLAELRRGVMELYISDHPLDCLTCSANGNCELQDMAGVVGLREVRYGMNGPTTSTCTSALTEGRIQPLFQLRPGQVHRLQPLRARLRGSPGHLRADHLRPRFRFPRRPGRGILPGLGMRVLRRLRGRPARPPR